MLGRGDATGAAPQMCVRGRVLEDGSPGGLFEGEEFGALFLDYGGVLDGKGEGSGEAEAVGGGVG